MDAKEKILSTKPSHRVFTYTEVPANCAAGRCGHKIIAIPKPAFTKENVLDAMDEYALRIIEWIACNEQDLSGVSNFNAKEYLEEIKNDINNQ